MLAQKTWMYGVQKLLLSNKYLPILALNWWNSWLIFGDEQNFKSLLLDANSGPESSGTGLKSGSAYDLVDLVTLAPLDIIEVFKFHVIIHATFFPEYFSRQKPAINIFPISTVQVGLLNEKPSTLSTELGWNVPQKEWRFYNNITCVFGTRDPCFM